MFYYELSNVIKHKCIINYLTIVLLIINIKHNYFPIEVVDKSDTHILQGFAGYVKAYILRTHQ